MANGITPFTRPHARLTCYLTLLTPSKRPFSSIQPLGSDGRRADRRTVRRRRPGQRTLAWPPGGAGAKRQGHLVCRQGGGRDTRRTQRRTLPSSAQTEDEQIRKSTRLNSSHL